MTGTEHRRWPSTFYTLLSYTEKKKYNSILAAQLTLEKKDLHRPKCTHDNILLIVTITHILVIVDIC